MAEELSRLTREIERVVTVPYVPSLQVTRNIPGAERQR
jgi:hypothetical protein